MAKLLFQGHGSLRLTTNENTVIYVDPYRGKGYDVPADYIIMTHAHNYRRQLLKPSKKPNCVVISNTDVVKDGIYKELDMSDVHVKAVPAYNKKNMDASENGVGYVMYADGKTLYVAGSTTVYPEMEELAKLNIDYAFLPTDGVKNMNDQEASVCAKMISAKHTIPIHMNMCKLFDPEIADNFNADSRLIMIPGQEIELE